MAATRHLRVLVLSGTVLSIAGFTAAQTLVPAMPAGETHVWLRSDSGLVPAEALPIDRSAGLDTVPASVTEVATGVDGATEARMDYGFAGVGFPHIDTVREEPHYKPYRQMVSFLDTTTTSGQVVEESVRRPIPYVRCMGLSPQTLARRAARWEAAIIDLSIRHGISASLVKAVITEESCFDPRATSPVGARGLMQLMPSTAAWLGVHDLTDAQQNLDAGIRYLAGLHARFDDSSLALAAYNAGPGTVRRFGGIPPFPETRRYVRRVQANHRRYVVATRMANLMHASYSRVD